MTTEIDQFSSFMNQGHSAAWEQKWEQAASFYREALKIDEDNPLALSSLGLALVELGQHHDALRCYQRCAQLEPDDPLPLEKIGQLCEITNNTKVAVRAYLRAADLHIKGKNGYKAINNWERVLQLDPNDLTANTRLGIIYEKMGEKTKAVKALLAAASGYQSSGSPEKARSTIEQALKILPNNPDAAHFLALLADYKPLPKEPRPHELKATGELKPNKKEQTSAEDKPETDPIEEANSRAIAILANLIFESEKSNVFQTKRRDLQTLVDGSPEQARQLPDFSAVRHHIVQSIDYQKQSNYEEAAAELEKAFELGLDHPAASFNLGYLYKQAGLLDKVSLHLQRAIKNDEFAFGGHMLYGSLLREKNQFLDAALEYLHALMLADIQCSPEDQRPGLQQWYELLTDTILNKQDDAVLNRICENVPNLLARPDWRVSLQRARQQISGTRKSGAVVPIGEMISQVDSSEVIESISAINELSNHGLLHSAMEEALYALQFAPNYLPLHALIAELLEKTGDQEAAIAKMRIISRTYEIRGDMTQSIAFSRRVVELSPGDLDEREKYVDQLTAAGYFEEAIEEMSRLAEFHYALADLKNSRTAYMRAYNIAQKAGGDPQLKVRLLQEIADIDLQGMDWRKSIDTFEQIRLIQPDNEIARDNIIRLNLRLGQETQAMAELDQYSNYLTGEQRGDELARFIAGLINDYPGKIPLRRRLVDVYRVNGQITDAVRQLDAIREMLLQAGDRSGAIQTVETIISMEPPNRGEYQLLLDQLRSTIQP